MNAEIEILNEIEMSISRSIVHECKKFYIWFTEISLKKDIDILVCLFCFKVMKDIKYPRYQNFNFIKIFNFDKQQLTLFTWINKNVANN